MSIIRDVADNLEKLFKQFQKYDYEWYTDPTYRDYNLMLQKRLAEVKSWTKEQREAFDKEYKQQLEDYIRINDGIREQLERLNEHTFPYDDPNAWDDMLDMLHRISWSYKYKKQRKGASFVAIMLYIYSAIDHGSWYAAMWLRAALETQRWSQAEVILKAITEEKGVRGEFAKDPELRALVPISKSVIYLIRDGEVENALEYARHAKENCGTSDLAVTFYHQLASTVNENRGALPETTVSRLMGSPILLALGIENQKEEATNV